MFILELFRDPQYFIFWIVIIIFSICFHELAHAVTAYWQGDDTAKNLGYFTLNPMVHMGKVSLICLVIIGLSWGLCPVNPYKMKHKYSDALVSFAGPFSNLLLAFIFAFFLVIVTFFFDNEYVVVYNLQYFFKLASLANAVLFVFNMIPIPPLDGSKVLSYFIPSLKSFYDSINDKGLLILFGIMIICPILSQILWGIGSIISYVFAKIFLVIFSLF